MNRREGAVPTHVHDHVTFMRSRAQPVHSGVVRRGAGLRRVSTGYVVSTGLRALLQCPDTGALADLKPSALAVSAVSRLVLLGRVTVTPGVDAR